MTETFKERMKRLRVRAGLKSQQDAADAIGCERGTVGMWEAPSSAVDSVSGDYLLAVARAYQVRPDYINTGKGDDGFPWTPDAATAKPSHSHPMRLDPERIAELATVLAERWKDVPGGFDLRNEEHAAHFVLCYGLYINMKERPVPENTVAFSAALTSPQGATRDERGKNVPATGTVKRRAGKGGKR
jgi:transcriptional regulator with XRE-family HTH domain